MKQSSMYHMRAVVDYPSGAEQVDSDHNFSTGTIPPDKLPRVAVAAPSPSSPAPAPGIEMLSLSGGDANQLTTAALDPAGNLIWFYEADATAQMLKLLPTGHLIMVAAAGNVTLIREIDLAGNTIRQLAMNDLNEKLRGAGLPLVNTIHHDVLPLANGHTIILANTPRIFTDLPGFPGQTIVTGDVIIDLDPDYNPVWAWSTFDHLDVNRHPMDFPDWTHANCLFYSPDDGNLMLSMRHQDWVIKIDYEDGRGSGDILWKLGYQGDFTLESGAPANWFYAQHYATIVSPNSTGDIQVELFDNGDNRVLDSNGTLCDSPGAEACYSRPAIFEVNETTRTARLVWAYNTAYSFWGGSAQLLPNGDIFFDTTAPADNPTGARAMQVTQQQDPEIMWRLDVTGENSYRTIHLPSLYPGVQW
jgi:hypothetical protein